MRETSIPLAVPRYVSWEKKLIAVELNISNGRNITKAVHRIALRKQSKKMIPGNIPSTAEKKNRYFMMLLKPVYKHQSETEGYLPGNIRKN